MRERERVRERERDRMRGRKGDYKEQHVAGGRWQVAGGRWQAASAALASHNTLYMH